MLLSKRTFVLCAVLMVFAALAIVFGIYDLQITLAVMDQTSEFGVLLEQLGVVVAPMFATLGGIAAAVFFSKEKAVPSRKVKRALSILAALIGAGYTVYTYSEFPAVNFICYTLVTFMLYVAALMLLFKAPRELLYKLTRIGIVAMFYLITILVAILAIKTFWGRIRPRDLEELSQFTPWFLPQGMRGEYSFPSGHTSNATSVYLLTMFAPFTNKKCAKALLYVVAIVWIVVMAYSRVLVGAHFASDTLFGAGISIALFYAVKAIVEPRLRPLGE